MNELDQVVADQSDDNDKPPKTDQGSIKSAFTNGDPRKDLDLHAMVLDSAGVAALIHVRDLPPSIMRTCEGLKIQETGEVLKPARKDLKFPETAPLASPLYANTRFGYFNYGEKALIWHIGAIAVNGFCIPSKQVVEACYVVYTDFVPIND